MQIGPRTLPVETRIPLDYFRSGDTVGDYAQIRELCHANPISSRGPPTLAAASLRLLKEESIELPYGFSFLLMSARADERGHRQFGGGGNRHALLPERLSGLQLDGARIARLGQMAENHVVGAPCGIMDQIAVASGREGKLTHILCRPGAIVGEVEIPPGTGFVGINSMVRHSVAGNAYGNVRIGAFMGKKIVNEIRAKTGRAAAELSRPKFPSEEFKAEFQPQIPETILGSRFSRQIQDA